MKARDTVLSSILVLACFGPGVWGQPADNRPDPPPAGGRGAPAVRGGMPQHPLMLVLDTDRDGELSEEEIKNATEALKKLDRDKDGRVSREEMRPGARGAGPVRGAGAGGDQFVRGLMSQDKNGDGKVTKDELPERMQRMLLRVDANGDGGIDRAEAEAWAKRFEGGGDNPPPGRRPAER